MNACPHSERPEFGRVCKHLVTYPDGGCGLFFNGVGLTKHLLCFNCAKHIDDLSGLLEPVCEECFRNIEKESIWERIDGSPEIRTRPSRLHFEHETVVVPELATVEIADLAPIEGSDALWSAYTADGAIVEIDVGSGSARTRARVPSGVFDSEALKSAQTWRKETAPSYALCVSHAGDVAAVAEKYGRQGIVIDLVTGTPTVRLKGDEYRFDVSAFSLAIVTHDGRPAVIYRSGWNRLDAVDARDGRLLTPREYASVEEGQQPPHYLDYFHGGLSVSPDGRRIAEDGWHWGPSGCVRTWNLEDWLTDNVWESEDGDTLKRLCWRSYFWDGPLCWLDDELLAVWGYGTDDEFMIPAARIFNARTGDELHWFAGPLGRFYAGLYLYSCDPKAGTSAWDASTGERVSHDPTFCPRAYHRNGAHFLTPEPGGRLRITRLVERGDYADNSSATTPSASPS
jgi:hypothetical protein